MSCENIFEYAIEVSGLSKCYQIYDDPTDRLKQMLMRGKRQYFREFWALKDINFKIKKGGAFGIVGRNGSGKSTLLQLICGTLNPTSGQIKINGRVAALLELGAGFNPEFTGVENVYLSASLYGISREEVDKRFGNIKEFADIGDHINQPVKTYSSGMYVRLAFAVIAHVDADILVIDEALAVGDAVFTQKCMRFIRDFISRGTLLFVSHDMGSVLNLCQNAIWLKSGNVKDMGLAKKVAELYLQSIFQETTSSALQIKSIDKSKDTRNDIKKEVIKRENILDYKVKLKVENNLNDANGWKTGGGEITEVSLNCVEKPGVVLEGGEWVEMRIQATLLKDMAMPILGFMVRDKLGQDLFGDNTLPYTNNSPITAVAGEKIQSIFSFKLPMLPNGEYSVMASLAEGTLEKHTQHHWLHNALNLHVVSSEVRWGLVGIEFDKIILSKY